MNAPVLYCAVCPFYDWERSFCRLPNFLDGRLRALNMHERCRDDGDYRRIDNINTIPSWCPLRLSPVVVHLEVK